MKRILILLFVSTLPRSQKTITFSTLVLIYLILFVLKDEQILLALLKPSLTEMYCLSAEWALESTASKFHVASKCCVWWISGYSSAATMLFSVLSHFLLGKKKPAKNSLKRFSSEKLCCRCLCNNLVYEHCCLIEARFCPLTPKSPCLLMAFLLQL